MKEKYEYNRFVLIGNGFDLSIGMPTSYNDFLLWFLKKYFSKALKQETVRTPILKVKMKRHDLDGSWLRNLNGYDKLEELIANYSFVLDTTESSRFYNFLTQGNNRWVDIEQLYFELLEETFSISKKSPRLSRDESKIEELNLQLQFLAQELQEYLSQVQCDNDIPETYNCSFFTQRMSTKLNNDAFFKSHGQEALCSDVRRSNVYYVNFNYTNFLRKTIYSSGDSTGTIIPIHGELTNEENEIIFGYGDDMNATYKEMELENSNLLLEHIKSFHYLKNNHYSDLLSCIGDKPFEVFIYGHSCGLSDRTFLTTLFEHNNCKAIKIFHRGCKEEHRRKAMNISRHFNDKFKMRARILDYDPDARIIQVVQSS